MARVRALVVFESMYGNTHAIADAVAEELAAVGEVEVRPVHEADPESVKAAELLVVGGPTHMHGLATSLSRRMAVKAGEEDGVEIEPGATAEDGLRTWLRHLAGDGRKAAAFDTRGDASPKLTGMAARGIARRLRRRGCDLVDDPQSFLVEDAEGPLAEGELARAREWGAKLAQAWPARP